MFGVEVDEGFWCWGIPPNLPEHAYINGTHELLT
jgi:hypothetical protein